MRLFLATQLSGVYLSAQAVVVAADETQARELLTAKLNDAGIPQSRPIQLLELDATFPSAYIVNNGDY